MSRIWEKSRRGPGSQPEKVPFIRPELQFGHDLPADPDTLQRFHEGDQEPDPFLRALQLRQHVAVLEILAEAGQPQPPGQLADLQPEAYLLHTAGKPDPVSARGLFREAGERQAPYLPDHIGVPYFFDSLFQVQVESSVLLSLYGIHARTNFSGTSMRSAACSGVMPPSKNRLQTAAMFSPTSIICLSGS